MSTPYTKKPGSKVEFSLTIEEKAIQSEMKPVLEHFRKDVSVKGFRKGHTPDDMVIASVGQDRIYYESLHRAVNKQYQEFISQNKLKPVSEPHIHMDEKKATPPFSLKVTVEVYPEVKVGDYTKITMKKPSVSIVQDEIDMVIRNILKERGVLQPVSGKAEKGHIVTVDFEGKDEKGNVLPATAAKDVVFEIGSGQFLEDLENAFVGMKAGEEKKGVKVSFPKDYHAQDMAGKKIPFDIRLIEVRTCDVSALTEDIIQEIVGEKKPVSEFRSDIEKVITERQLQEEQKKCIDEYTKKLVPLVKTDLPESWIEDDVNAKINNIKQSPHFQKNPDQFWKSMKKTEEDLRKEFRTPAKESLLVFLALSHIVEKEGIELDKDEMAHAQSLAQKQDGKDGASQLPRFVFHLKIDKYLKGLTL